ncbi:hypothetical protein DSO57_1006827 [Entomophthora muscae]|uniref:Uncharacterized protein n=1 Tax=Entomophthora muscae TaxID=34485 RepID=A0ACC2TUH3_9FUNG|nr:hypothetical protein DSO57_1006827 [Entomophthora muscae]
MSQQRSTFRSRFQELNHQVTKDYPIVLFSVLIAVFSGVTSSRMQGLTLVMLLSQLFSILELFMKSSFLSRLTRCITLISCGYLLGFGLIYKFRNVSEFFSSLFAAMLATLDRLLFGLST